MHTEFLRISWIYEGEGELLNLNSNLNSVEKGKRIGKINFEKKRIERDIYIYICIRAYTVSIRGAFIGGAGGAVRK